MPRVKPLFSCIATILLGILEMIGGPGRDLYGSELLKIVTRNVEIPVYSQFEGMLSDRYTLFSPVQDLVTTRDQWVVKGVNRSLTPVYVNGHKVPVRRDGRFFYTVNLKLGPQAIYVGYVSPDAKSVPTLKRQVRRYSASEIASGNAHTASDLFFTLNLVPNAETRGPKAVATRGDLALILVRLSSGNVIPKLLYDEWSPSDLEVGTSMGSIAQKAVRNGLMDLYPDGQFRPMAPISRFDYVLGVVKALGLPLKTPPYGMPYKNIPSGYWPAKYIATAYHAGLIEGGDRFEMGGAVTLGDLAQGVASIKSIQAIYQSASAARREGDVDHRHLNRVVTEMVNSLALPTAQTVVVPSVSPVSIAASQDLYIDLKGHWLEKTVKTMHDKGLLADLESPNGKSDRTLFFPRSSISRGDFARLLVSVYRVATGNAVIAPTDLPTTHGAYGAISVLMSAGIFVPDRSGQVYPDRLLTKIEALVMVERISGIEPTGSMDVHLPFRDVNSKAWVAPYVQAALDHKLISPAPFYLPLFPITRAEVIALIAKTPPIAEIMK